MRIIEPCCAKKHLMMLRDAIAGGGTTQFEGYGDLSLAELLPAILTRYCETDMVIAAPSLPDQAAEAVLSWMRRDMARMDGRGRLYYVRRLTVIADLSEDMSPMASRWMEDNPFGDRLRLVGMQHTDTAILLPDFAITGPVNMQYANHFIATATTDAGAVAALWEKFMGMTDNAPSADIMAPAAKAADGAAKKKKPSKKKRASKKK